MEQDPMKPKEKIPTRAKKNYYRARITAKGKWHIKQGKNVARGTGGLETSTPFGCIYVHYPGSRVEKVSTRPRGM